MAEAVKKEEPKKKGLLGKLKEATEDKEEQLAILSTFVRTPIVLSICCFRVKNLLFPLL